MGIPVTRFELHPMPDGRQALILEFNDGAEAVVSQWYGRLEAEPVFSHMPMGGETMWDLTMNALRGGSSGWGRLTVRPPRENWKTGGLLGYS